MSEPVMLTLREVAALLRVGLKTAYTLAQDGELPGFKVGGQWRFRRADIDSWIDAQMHHGQHDDGESSDGAAGR